jgi:hypothetical protein
MMVLLQKDGLEPGEKYSLGGAYLLVLPVAYIGSYLFCLILLFKVVRRWWQQRRRRVVAIV